MFDIFLNHIAMIHLWNTSIFSQCLNKSYGSIRSTWRVLLVPNGNKFVLWGRNWWQYTLLPWTDLWSQGRQNFAELKKYWLMAHICRGGESQSWSKSCSTDRWPQRLGRTTHQVVETLGRRFCIGSCSLVVRHFHLRVWTIKGLLFIVTRFLQNY